MPKPELDNSQPAPSAGPISPVPDHRSASTLNFDYLLDEKGQIWIRSRTPDNPQKMDCGNRISAGPEALEWSLYNGKGVPYDKEGKSLLAPGEKIVEISVSSDIVIAVSNFGRVFLYKPTEKKRPLPWEKVLGSPEHISSGKLYLPQNRRDWASSCSVCTKPEERTTEFMHEDEIVGWFRDANGIPNDFGFTLTIYALVDELKIVYWDTGLPASFSRGFLVPKDTQGIALSAAGSTVFLSAIDSEGKLRFFTRMIDYEINGACPGLKVSYSDIPAVQPPEDSNGSFFLGQGVRKMPLPGWVEHSVEDILPNISHKVCIRLTGKGDEARELRIQGKDPESGWGYYAKNITESTWQFHPAPEAAPLNIEENQVFQYNPELPEMQRFSYTGKLLCTSKIPYTKKPDPDISLELKDFHPFLTDSEPFSLVINHPGEPPQHLKIHAVDAWGLHRNKKYDPKLVGWVDDKPNELIATLVLTAEQIELTKNKQSAIGAYIKNHFLEYNEKTKAIPIIADNGMAILKFGSAKCCFKRALSENEKNYSFYMRKAMEPQLIADPESPEDCAELIDLNKSCLKEIKAIFSQRRTKDRIYKLINTGASALRPFASGLFKYIIKPEDPTYEQAISDIRLLFKVHKWAETHTLKGKTQAVGYEKAVTTLEERIKQLEETQNQYQATHLLSC